MDSILAFLFAFLIAYALTPFTIQFARKYSLVTDKTKRVHPAHTHVGIIPRGGGIPIFIAILLVALIFLPLNKIMVGILISSFLLLIVGVLDDKYDLSPYLRFGANIFVSAIVIGFGLGIPFISNPFGGVIRLDGWRLVFDFFGKHSILILADMLAIFWLVWTTNMINWSKGVDGQLPGFVGIAAIFLGILSQRFVVHDVSAQVVMTLAFIVGGAFLGFLPYNFYPQSIMPGYGFGALAGFLLGILSILSFGKIGTAFLILAIPMIDASYTIIRRIIYKKSPFRADWGHLHHRLLDIGWGKRRIAVFYWSVTFILGMASLFLEGIEKLISFVMIALILLIFILIIQRMKKQQI